MNANRKLKEPGIPEDEIDRLVEAEADNEEAWSKPVKVRRRKSSASVTLPASLADRASFVAKMHKERNLEEWLERIITERVQLEESAFVEIKRSMSSHRRP